MTTTATPAIESGSTWVATRGKHTGVTVEVIRRTPNGVSVKPVGGNGASWSTGKSKRSGTWTVRLDLFLAGYARRDSLSAPAVNGSAYRRIAAPVIKPIEPVPVSVEPRESGLRIEVTTVTPDLASAWLERGGLNRKLSGRRVDILVAAIRRGEWRLTGEAVKLDANGCVRDGQHRLSAIAKAGIPVPTLVIYGVDEPAFDVMDTGRPRNAADVLSIHGYVSQIALASSARGLMLIEGYGRYAPQSRDAGAGFTTASTLEYIRTHPEVSDGVRLADRLRSVGFQGGSGLWGTVMTMFLRIDPEQAEMFTVMLSTGANMSAGHPALLLRNRALTAARGTFGPTSAREALAAIAIKAWNAWRSGRTLQQLSWRGDGQKPETFPAPV